MGKSSNGLTNKKSPQEECLFSRGAGDLGADTEGNLFVSSGSFKRGQMGRDAQPTLQAGERSLTVPLIFYRASTVRQGAIKKQEGGKSIEERGGKPVGTDRRGVMGS